MDFYVHICQNGHTLIAREKISGAEFCEQCGAAMIDKCPSCNATIEEWHFSGAYLGKPSYARPAYCQKCGKPYPWTKASIDATTELIAEEEALNDIERKKLIASLPDLIVETPKTQLAIVRVKKAFASAGSFTIDALRQFAIDFGCELVKSQLKL